MEKAAFRLANALLSIANEDSGDVDVLKRAALQRMALDTSGGGKPPTPTGMAGNGALQTGIEIAKAGCG